MSKAHLLIEIIDGFLLIMVLFSASYFALYLIRETKFLREYKKIRAYENKAAIALFMLMVGLMLKNGTEWWLFHLRNHGDDFRWPVLLPLLTAGTGISGWGLVCLLRSLSRYEWSSWTWFWLTLVAAAFGIGMAIY